MKKREKKEKGRFQEIGELVKRDIKSQKVRLMVFMETRDVDFLTSTWITPSDSDAT